MAYGSTKTTPLASVTVNNTTIPQVTYKGQPVLTMKAIAALHGVHPQVIRNNFTVNKTRFIEGVDYIRLSYAEARQLNFSSHTLFSPNTSTGVILFTKSGYLMLVKSLQGDKAWEAQRVLVNTYFQHEEVQAVLKETGGVYVSEEAMFDDDDLLIAKALKAADIMLAKRDAQIAEMQLKVES